MFYILKILGLILMIVAIIFHSAKANDGESTGRKATMTCFHVEVGIVWCSRSTKDAVEYSVSFSNEDIADHVAYRKLIKLLKYGITELLRKLFLVSCEMKCVKRTRMKICSCQDYVYQSLDPGPDSLQPITDGNGSERRSSVRVRFDMFPLPRTMKFFSIDSEQELGSRLETREIRVRAPKRKSACRNFARKTQREQNDILYDIVRDRHQRGYYSKAGRRPHMSIKEITQEMRRIDREIRRNLSGNLQVVRTKSKSSRSSSTSPRSRKRRSLREQSSSSSSSFRGGRSRPSSSSSDRRGNSRGTNNQYKVLVPKKPISYKKKQKPTKKATPKNDNYPTPPDAEYLLRPENNVPTEFDIDNPRLKEEKTPRNDPRNSQPVDENKLMDKLFKLQAERGETGWNKVRRPPPPSRKRQISSTRGSRRDTPMYSSYD